jgi:SAM-dependent methyltransferase
MLPKSKAAEKEHRRRKRAREVELIIDAMRERLGARADRTILEFGSGDGFQVPYLQRIGKLVASDVYRSERIDALGNLDFVVCSIADTPFADGQFDVVFSNHVIEHVTDLPAAFREMRRIGKPDCLYAFSVPTNIWLVLSVPGQYYSRVVEGLARAGRRQPEARIASAGATSVGGDLRAWRQQPRPTLGQRLLRLVRPTGHGTERRFGPCYRRFRIGTWERLFRDAGFEIVATRPLLLYGPSKWPLIPTMTSRGRLCSSVLFLMRKPAAGPATRP